MRDSYGLSPNEYELVLSKLYNQPVTIISDYVYNEQGNSVYYEISNGFWQKWGYDEHGNLIYREDSTGFWVKYEYDNQGNEIYSEDNNGYIIDNR
jgi:YD repeat-containing protein